MVKLMVENYINKIFKELEVLTEEIAKKEVNKKHTSSIKELTLDSVDPDTEVRITALIFKLSILKMAIGE